MIDPAAPDYTNTPTSGRRPGFGYSPADPVAPPQVTIVTPFHDTGEVFHETARSVLGQSFQQWEWLIVNDGSRDPVSLAVLDGYRCRDSRIRVIDQEQNGGPGAARNIGYVESRTPYVVQLDSDNLLEPTAIEKWLWYMESFPQHGFVKGFTVGFGAETYLMRGGFHEGRQFTRRNRVDATALVRRSVHAGVGGYDETIRGGMEDWEFWLRCANAGHWGGTVPEYLDWFRRRPSHADRWPDWDEGERQRAFQATLRARYPGLWNGGFPEVEVAAGNGPVRTDVPFANVLRRERRRLLVLIPWYSTGGADNFNVALLEQLVGRGWEVSVLATLHDRHPALARFARITPDVFVLPHFLRLEDAPRFVAYMIRSRQPDAVLTTNTELGYRILPLIRSLAPDVPILDYCHVEEPWGDGGYPRCSVESEALLDSHVVASAHLARWMINRGAAAERVRVCTINVDASVWRPDQRVRERVRRELGIDGATPLILFAGRLCPQKQPAVLARALELLHAGGTRFTAVVAGDGPGMRRLRRFVKRRGLESTMRLAGEVSSDRMRELMQAADLFFLPSRYEGIALSFYEAMACGVTVVGAAVGGQAELVTPECGVLIERSDAGSEAERYATVLAHLCADERRRLAMGRAARERVVKHFRLDAMGDAMVAAIDEAIERRRTMPGPVPDEAEACREVEGSIAELRARDGFALPTAFIDPLDGIAAWSDWRASVYRTLFRIHEPVFHWYTGRGWTWVHPVRRAVRRLLLRFATGQ